MIVLFIKLHSMKQQIKATYRRILGDVNVHFCSLAYRLTHSRRRRMYNRPIRLTQCCTQFKFPGDKILCVLYLHYNVAFTFK